MLTSTNQNSVSERTSVPQNETFLSDAEISRRVMRIRSGWSVGEKVRRRREAEERFADLMGKLVGDTAA
ncbi:MAG: hypothetical protein L7W43_07285 [Rubripirellula sp.]|nr:hypothetical protein [Rhodopirellula sp.]MCH1439441.1 hypothetical protein [Rubripirellula sp.]OUX06275.1 MAG: hypothetical protein CBE00_07995 [Planctomycetaceae bacterium TMED240]